MFGRCSITYFQPRQMIVSKVVFIFAPWLGTLLISCSRTSCQKGYVSVVFYLLSVLFADDKKRNVE